MALKETTQAREHALPTTVYTLTPEATVDQAAYLMASRGVGNVVVVQGGRPVGILTDRDIVVRVTGAGLDARDLTVADVMSQPVITIQHDVDISHAVALMSRHGIRRLPIVDDEGALVSILTLDDLQMMGLSDRPELSGLIERQLHSEQGPPRRGRRRRVPPPVPAGSTAAKTETQPKADQWLPATVYTVAPDSQVGEVARLMAGKGVGTVVVVEDQKPVGVLTDRDIVVRVAGAGLDPKSVRVRDIMSKPPITVTRNAEISQAVGLMRLYGIRRLPIVDEEGRLVSIVTMDDVILLGLDQWPDLRHVLERQLRPGSQKPEILPVLPAMPSPQTSERGAQPRPAMRGLEGPVSAVARASVTAPAEAFHRRPWHDVVRAWWRRNRIWLLLVLFLSLLGAASAMIMDLFVRADLTGYQPDEERRLFLEERRLFFEKQAREQQEREEQATKSREP